ncbi:MAG TPA: PEGA domain-containing protein [Bryobacteraceae bacterium]|nr:PEGA domain-containing protein [Bryobacteraceae bacterium]
MRKLPSRWCAAFLFCGIAAAEVQIPEGTRIRVRLDQDLSSATAEQGQPVRLTVVEEIRVNETSVIAAGAAVAGEVTVAVPRTMTSSGKLDFSATSVTAADGAPIPLRYRQDTTGAGSAGGGLLAAGATVLFGPTVTMLRMMRAKDIVLAKGMVLEVFTNQSHILQAAPAQAGAAAAPATQTNSATKEETDSSGAGELIILSINSTPAGAKITVDGADMGETPASFQLDPGAHDIQVEKSGLAIWKRKITAKAGTPIDLDVKLLPVTKPKGR